MFRKLLLLSFAALTMAGVSSAQEYDPPKTPPVRFPVQAQLPTVTRAGDMPQLPDGIIAEGARLNFRSEARPCFVSPKSVTMLPGGLFLSCSFAERRPIEYTMYLGEKGNGMITPERVMEMVSTYGADDAHRLVVWGVKGNPQACPVWLKSFVKLENDNSCFELTVMTGYTD